MTAAARPRDATEGAAAPTTLLVLGLVAFALTVGVVSIGRAAVSLQQGTAAADAAALAVDRLHPPAGG